MIGKILQHILDKGFFVRFIYDGGIGYIFRAWKYYEGDMCQCEWVVSDCEVIQSIAEEVLFMEAGRYLKQIDDNIVQRRLIDSATKG